MMKNWKKITLGILLVIIISIFPVFDIKQTFSQSTESEALNILTEKFNQGEITEDEYNVLYKREKAIWRDIHRKEDIERQLNALPSTLSNERRSELEAELASLTSKTKNDGKTLDEDIKSASEDEDNCGLTNLTACVTRGFHLILGIIGEVLTLITAGIVKVAGGVFGYSLDFGVKKIGTFVNDPGVTLAWSTLRDFANLFFIFILLYVAAAFILDLKVNNKERIIITVIISALFINFSAFLARAVIDVANIAAAQLYEPIAQKGVAGTFLRNSDFTTEMFTLKDGSPIEVLIRIFGNVVLGLVISFTLLAGAVLLLIRSVYLVFLIVISPLAFLARAMPNMEKYFKDWWDKLLNQSFFAPIYILFIYSSITILDTGIIKRLSENKESNWLGLIFNFAIVVGLMIGSLIAAVKLSAFGANTVVGYGKKMKDWGIGAAKGAGIYVPSAIGRATIGRWSAEAIRAEETRNKDDKGGWITRMMTTSPRLANLFKPLAEKGTKAMFGGKESFKEVTEKMSKPPKELKTEESKAKYIEAAGKGFLGVKPLLGNYIQQQAYRQLGAVNQAKMEAALNKAQTGIKTQDQLWQEIQDATRKHTDILNWYANTPETDRLKTENESRMRKYRKAVFEMMKLEEARTKAPKDEKTKGVAEKEYRHLSKVVEEFKSRLSASQQEEIEKNRQKSVDKDARKKSNEKKFDKAMETVRRLESKEKAGTLSPDEEKELDSAFTVVNRMARELNLDKDEDKKEDKKDEGEKKEDKK